MKYNKLKNDMAFQHGSTTKILNHNIHESAGDVTTTSTKDYKNHKLKFEKPKKMSKKKKKAIKEIISLDTCSTKELKILKNQTGSDVHSKKKLHNFNEKPFEYYSAVNYHNLNTHIKFTDEDTTTNISNDSNYTEVNHLQFKKKKKNKKSKPAGNHTAKIHQCHMCQKTFKKLKSLKIHNKQNHSRNQAHIAILDQKNINEENDEKHTLLFKKKKKNKKSKPAGNHTAKIHQCHMCQKTFKKLKSLKIHNKQNHSRNQAHIAILDQKNINEENDEKHTLLFKEKKKKKNKVYKNKNEDDTSELTNIDLKCNAIPQIYTTPQKKVKNIIDNSHNLHHTKNDAVADYTKRKYCNEIYKCDVCEVSFDILSALQNHKSLAHQEKKVASPPTSITEVSSKDDEKETFSRGKKVKKKKEKLMVDNQIKTTLKENKKLQRISSLEVLSNNDLENDLALVHKNKEDNYYPIYKCKDCKMSFGLLSAFTKHNLNNHSANNSIVTQGNNSICSENNDQESPLLLKKLPKQMENKNEKAFRKADPVIISQNKTNMLEPQSPCDISRNKYLENDFVIHPDEVFINIFYKCNICSMFFEDSYALKEHKNRVHIIDKSVVTESFTSKNSEDDYEFTQLLKKMVKLLGKKKKQKNENTSTFLNEINHVMKSLAPIEESTILPNEVIKCKESIDFEVHPKDISKSYVPATFSEKSQSSKNLNECNICSKKFSDKYCLNIHYRIHTGEKPFKCDVCGKSFVLKSQLTIHYRTHTGEKPYECDICSNSFGQKKALISHYRRHTGEKPFKCDICSHSFRHKITLISHYRIHTGEKPFKCDVCGKSFVTKSQLTTHYRTHTGEKPYECDICSNSFGQKMTLISHYRIHTGEKPYKCDICSHSFRQKGTLNTHYKLHTRENLFECDICSRLFLRKSNLTEHYRIHTGEKPYECDFCEMTFRSSTACSRHKRRKHDRCL